MLEIFEPVEIFDQFLFLICTQLANITFWEAFRIIFNRLINSLCLDSVKHCDIRIDQHLLTAQLHHQEAFF